MDVEREKRNPRICTPSCHGMLTVCAARRAITIVRRAGALGHTVTHPTSKNPTCRDVFCLLFRHRHIKYDDYKLLPPGRFGVVSEVCRPDFWYGLPSVIVTHSLQSFRSFSRF